MVVSVEGSDSHQSKYQNEYYDNSEFDSDNKNTNLNDYFKSSTTDSIYDNKYMEALVEDRLKNTKQYLHNVVGQDFRHKNKYVKIPYGENQILGSQYKKAKRYVDTLSEESQRNTNTAQFDNPDSSFDRAKKLVIKKKPKHKGTFQASPMVPKLDLKQMSSKPKERRIKIKQNQKAKTQQFSLNSSEKQIVSASKGT